MKDNNNNKTPKLNCNYYWKSEHFLTSFTVFSRTFKMKTSSFVIAAVAVFAIAAAIDSDGDGVDDSEDVCPFMASSSSSQLNSDTDRDGDGVGNACDCQSLERSDAGYHLGELMKWNAIVFGDMLAYGSVTEGRLAVQGDVWAQNYGTTAREAARPKKRPQSDGLLLATKNKHVIKTEQITTEIKQILFLTPLTFLFTHFGSC